MFKYTRLKKLLNAILEANSLEEVYRLGEKFVGDNTQISGTLMHRKLQITYHFIFDRDQRHVQIGLCITEATFGLTPLISLTEAWDHAKTPYIPPMFNLQINVKEDQLPVLQSTIVSFLSMLR